VHQIRFRPGLSPGPRWGSSRRSPDPLVGWGGDTPSPFPTPSTPSVSRSLDLAPSALGRRSLQQSQLPSMLGGLDKTLGPTLSQGRVGLHQLEHVQRIAARFVMNDYCRTTSVTSLLNQREWSPLSVRRRNSRLVAFYRAVSNLSPVPVGQPRPCSHQTRLYDPVTFTPLRPQITTHHCRLELAGRCRSHYEPNRRLNHTMQVSSTSLSRRHLIEQNHKTPAVTGHTHCWIFHRSTKVTFDIDSCNGVIYRNGAHR